MNIQTIASNLAKLRWLTLTAITALGAASLNAANIDWTATESGNWAITDNWTIAGTTNHQVPTSDDSVFIGSTTEGLVVDVDTSAEGGILSIGRQSTASSNLSATLRILDGANLTLRGAILGYDGLSSGSILQLGGTVNITTTTGLQLGRWGNTISGDYTINSGTLSVVQGIVIGYRGNGSFYQNDGSVSANVLTVGDDVGSSANTATYELGGGSLTVGTLNLGHTNGSSAATSSMLLIKGSSATAAVSGNFTISSTDYSVTTLNYQIDNGGATAINLTGSGAATLAGTLDLGFEGGVALVQTNSFTLVEANTGNITGSFSSGPNSALWETSIETISGTRDALVATLNSSAQVGTLAAQGETLAGTTFSAASYGYLSLANLESGAEVTIYLDADAGTDKSIADLIDYFTESGIVASASSEGDYDIAIAYTAADDTGTFAWDLNSFNADATLSGIGVSMIPEPGQFALLAGIFIGAIGLIRRHIANS